MVLRSSPTKRYALVAAYTLPILSEGELVTHEAEDQPTPADWQEDTDVDAVPPPEADPLPEQGEAERVSKGCRAHDRDWLSCA